MRSIIRRIFFGYVSSNSSHHLSMHCSSKTSREGKKSSFVILMPFTQSHFQQYWFSFSRGKWIMVKHIIFEIILSRRGHNSHALIGKTGVTFIIEYKWHCNVFGGQLHNASWKMMLTDFSLDYIHRVNFFHVMRPWSPKCQEEKTTITEHEIDSYWGSPFKT